MSYLLIYYMYDVVKKDSKNYMCYNDEDEKNELC